MSFATGDCSSEDLPNMDDWEWDLDGKQPKWMASLTRPQNHRHQVLPCS